MTPVKTVVRTCLPIYQWDYRVFFQSLLCFCGVIATSVSKRASPVLREEICVNSGGAAREDGGIGFSAVTSSSLRKEGFPPYLRLASDEQTLLRCYKFKMLAVCHLLWPLQPRDWLASVDLHDAYFHNPHGAQQIFRRSPLRGLPTSYRSLYCCAYLQDVQKLCWFYGAIRA